MKAKAHIRYKNAAGELVPGVTTVIGQLAIPALASAANKLGLQGIDSKKYWGELAEIGTLAHDMISCSLKGVECDTSEYSKVQIDKATNSHLSYLEWAKGHNIKPFLAEQPLVSEEHLFGGTLDCACLLDGAAVLIDYKTGGIYIESHYQMAAYRMLLRENNWSVDKAIVLGIPRTEDESFKEEVYTSFDTAWEIFKALLMVYNLKRRMKHE